MKTQNCIIYLCIAILLSLNLSSAGEISLADRSDEVKYHIVILHGNEAKERTYEGTPMSMTSPVTKEKLTCYIPPERSNEYWEEVDGEVEHDVKKSLEPLASSCLYRLAGWWKYEFCLNRHVRQYHQEGDKPVRAQDEYYLGRYYEQSGEEYPEYYREMYSDGTVCDITGQPRTVEVRYYCSQATGSLISDIKETSSCNYVMAVATPLLCHHTAYKPKKERAESVYCVSNEEESLLVTHLETNEKLRSSYDKGKKAESANSQPYFVEMVDGQVLINFDSSEGSYSDEPEDFQFVQNADGLASDLQQQQNQQNQQNQQQEQQQQSVQQSGQQQQQSGQQQQQQQSGQQQQQQVNNNNNVGKKEAKTSTTDNLDNEKVKFVAPLQPPSKEELNDKRSSSSKFDELLEKVKAAHIDDNSAESTKKKLKGQAERIQQQVNEQRAHRAAAAAENKDSKKKKKQ